MSAGPARITRLLNLVPFLLEHPGISAPDAAGALGIDVGTLMDDLRQVWLCGLPGYGPGDLIDLDFSFESITVTFDAGMTRPLRLTSIEATALLLGLASLAENPGLADPEVVRSAIAKLEAAAGVAAPAPPTAAMGNGTPGPDIPGTVRDAVVRGRALRLRYWSATSDRVTTRVVDPIELAVGGANTYLVAWCREASGPRDFRLDRIETAEILDEESRPGGATTVAGSAAGNGPRIAGSLHGAPTTATLRVLPSGAWLAEYHSMTVIETSPDGVMLVTMPYGDEDWLLRLLLGAGGVLRLIEPAGLRGELRRRALEALGGDDR